MSISTDFTNLQIVYSHSRLRIKNDQFQSELKLNVELFEVRGTVEKTCLKYFIFYIIFFSPSCICMNFSGLNFYFEPYTYYTH